MSNKVYRILNIILIVWCCGLFVPSTYALSQAEASEKLLTPNFEEINNDWWTEWPQLSQEEKNKWLTAIRKNFDGVVSDIDYSSERHENIVLIHDLLDSLNKLVTHQPEEQLPEPKSELTLQSWLALYRSTERLNNERQRIQAEKRQRTDAIRYIQGQLQELNVLHRKLEPQSFERASNGIAFYAAQINMLYAQEKLISTDKQLNSTQAKFKTTTLRLAQSAEEITSSPSFDKQLTLQKNNLLASIEKLKSIMSSLQRRAWSSLKGEKEIVFQLSYQEEKLKLISAQSQLLSIDILLHISQMLQGMGQVSQPEWGGKKARLIQEYELLNSQLASYREQVLVSGEAANEMIYAKTQRTVWEYLEANQKLSNELKSKLRDVDFYLQSYQQFISLRKGWLSELGFGWSLWSDQAGSSLDSTINFTLFTVNEYPVTLFDLLNAILVIVLSILFSKFLKKVLYKFGQKKAVSESTIFNVARVLHYVIITTAALIALSILGIDSSKITLIAGALSVGIGFGLQAIFNNFVSGLILLFERPLKVGDLVELESGVRGRIKAINVRSTQLKTRDNIDVLVPNSEFVNFRVINYTFSDPLRRIHIPFRTSLDSDKDKVRKVVIAAAEEINFTQKDKQHAPDLWLKTIGEFSLEFELVVWVNANKLPDNDGVEAAYLWKVESALREANIEVPVPQKEIYLKRVTKVNKSIISSLEHSED
ncbi:mechanosensitive ion channel family protein [Aliikangiella coralliicola]|nr:mechanosensitive ion channel domain-containing protein [Aliikangiella coralliicola]